ncbi:hypothetical protein TNCV_1209821 [Trichonephila clavipes]|nr:hypothetical protein TNCV_1209821 [Trichonephila clavipes]
MFDPSSFADPTPLAHADASRDVFPRGANLPPPKVAAPGRGPACPPLAPALLRVEPIYAHSLKRSFNLIYILNSVRLNDMEATRTSNSRDPVAYFWSTSRKQNTLLWAPKKCGGNRQLPTPHNE